MFRPEVLETAPVVRPVETAITHNGDLDALTFRGVRIAHPDLGFFLERVLGAENRWIGDSPSLAGAFELFLTQGLWLEAIRLAYLEVDRAAAARSIVRSTARAIGPNTRTIVRRVLRDYPVPTPRPVRGAGKSRRSRLAGDQALPSRAPVGARRARASGCASD